MITVHVYIRSGAVIVTRCETLTVRHFDNQILRSVVLDTVATGHPRILHLSQNDVVAITTQEDE